MNISKVKYAYFYESGMIYKIKGVYLKKKNQNPDLLHSAERLLGGDAGGCFLDDFLAATLNRAITCEHGDHRFVSAKF